MLLRAQAEMSLEHQGKGPMAGLGFMSLELGDKEMLASWPFFLQWPGLAT